MPFSTAYHSQHQVAVFSLRGTVNTNDLEDLVRTAYSHPRWNRKMRVVWDCRRIESLNLSPGDEDKVVAAFDEHATSIGPGKSAVVVARHIDYAIAKLISTRRKNEGRQVKICYSLGEALEWLSIPKEVIN